MPCAQAQAAIEVVILIFCFTFSIQKSVTNPDEHGHNTRFTVLPILLSEQTTAPFASYSHQLRNIMYVQADLDIW